MCVCLGVVVCGVDACLGGARQWPGQFKTQHMNHPSQPVRALFDVLFDVSMLDLVPRDDLGWVLIRVPCQVLLWYYHTCTTRSLPLRQHLPA